MGFIAAGMGDVRRSEVIFGALSRLRPQRAFAPIGLAMAYANVKRYDEAAETLERALATIEAVDERGDVEAFRGLVLQLGGRTSESLRALRAAGPVRLAQCMLGLVPDEATHNQEGRN